ncbi:pyridoxamine 5'-phosphate oxidase-related FMN-binding protein [Zopfochytrium polystomum]|nr:pyridoxamine 5'-phosphate oxidase-related FMN-binding protein [Zopfochytrium polystomum]
MVTFHDSITPSFTSFILAQHLFFVATAPTSTDGHVNVSPKGHAQDCLYLLDSNTAVYFDLTGSGVETISHIQDNKRITVMFCALDGKPMIVRLFGTGSFVEKGRPRFATLLERIAGHAREADASVAAKQEDAASSSAAPSMRDRATRVHEFAAQEGCRAAIVIDIRLVSRSCGFAVPLYDFVSARDDLLKWSLSKGADGLEKYRESKNAKSLDGLPGLPAFAQQKKWWRLAWRPRLVDVAFGAILGFSLFRLYQWNR